MVSRRDGYVAWLLIVLLPMLGMPTLVQAEVITTAEVEDSAHGDPRARLRAYLAREEVSRELIARGVSRDQVEARVNAMTDQEVARLSLGMDNLPAGGFVDALVAMLVVGAQVLFFAVVGVFSLIGSVVEAISGDHSKASNEKDEDTVEEESGVIDRKADSLYGPPEKSWKPVLPY